MTVPEIRSQLFGPFHKDWEGPSLYIEKRSSRRLYEETTHVHTHTLTRTYKTKEERLISCRKENTKTESQRQRESTSCYEGDPTTTTKSQTIKTPEKTTTRERTQHTLVYTQIYTKYQVNQLHF